MISNGHEICKRVGSNKHEQCNNFHEFLSEHARLFDSLEYAPEHNRSPLESILGIANHTT